MLPASVFHSIFTCYAQFNCSANGSQYICAPLCETTAAQLCEAASARLCEASSPRSIILSPLAINSFLRATLCLFTFVATSINLSAQRIATLFPRRVSRSGLGVLGITPSIVLAIAIILCPFLINAQRIATLQLTTKGNEKYAIPMQTNLDAMTFLPDSILQLNEITAGKKVSVPYQVEACDARILHWLVQPSKNKQRIFELVKAPATHATQAMQAMLNNGELILSEGNRNLVTYNYKTVYPPAAVDTAYKRSGFIHPLNTPNGQALTRINARDHYHHWGLWNPWTHVLFEKDTVDFWNLKDRKGTVRFSGFGAIDAGDVFSGFTALHEHIAFKKSGEEKIAINELQTIRTYKPEPNSNYYIMDITVQLSCASASPVKLLEYRYGGLGIRATELWNKDNSMTLTSEDKDRKAADGSTARWCLAQGQLGNDYGGLIMMSYPANYNHPEPLRVWPENSNGRGDVFLNFSPTKNKDWLLEPGKSYILKYRFLVFNNKMGKADADELWQSFAKPPAIKVLGHEDTKTKRNTR